MATTDTIVQRFASWARDRRGLEPDVVDTLVTFKGDYLGDGDPTTWRSGELSELMLGILPRTVSADAEWVAAAVPTMRAFVRWAGEIGVLSGASSRQLAGELDGIEPQFVSAMGDWSRFGLAKAVLDWAGAGTGNLDLGDPAAVQEAMDRFNALPEDQRKAITDPALGGLAAGAPPGRGIVLPAVVLPGVPVLAEAARSAPLMQRTAALAAWVGRRRAVTATGVLRLAAARAAITELGLLADARAGDPDGDGTGRPARPAAPADGDPVGQLLLGMEAGPARDPALDELRSARDAPSLHLPWVLAAESGLVDVGAATATQGPAWPQWSGDADDDVLAVWADVFATAVGLGAEGVREHRWRLAAHEAVDGLVAELFPQLYAGSSVTVAELVDRAVVAEPVGEAVAGMHRHMVEECWQEVLDRLVDVGALHRDGDTVAMTPLGRWGLREQMLGLGADAPVLSDPETSDAGSLARHLMSTDPDEASRIWAGWVAARTPEQAAGEMVSAARDAGPLERTVLFAAMGDHCADAGAATLSGHLDDPLLGGHARAWLASAGMLPPGEGPSAEQSQWLAVDAVASFLELVGGPVGPRELPVEICEILEAGLDLSTAWRIDHPELVAVLDTAGVGHPQGRVRKAAKKAAFKARSRST